MRSDPDIPAGLTRSILPSSVRKAIGELPEGRSVSYASGDQILGEGDDSDHIVLLVSGVVKITAVTPTGREALLGLRGPGELVGELAALTRTSRSATVRAIDRVEARLVAASLFRRFLHERPEALFDLLEAVIVRLREADRRRLEFTGWDVFERVCSLLAELVGTHGRPADGGGTTIGLALSQEEIAGATGASREAVAKALRTLRADGTISTARKQITVLDLPRLRRVLQAKP